MLNISLNDFQKRPELVLIFVHKKRGVSHDSTIKKVECPHCKYALL